MAEFSFNLLEIHSWYGSQWFSLCNIVCGDFDGALLHVERTYGVWKFELLYLRQLYYKWRDK